MVDVKEGKFSFNVGKNHVEFRLFKDHVSSSSSIASCGIDVLDYNKTGDLIDICLNDLHVFDDKSCEDDGIDSVKVALTETLPPPNIVKNIHLAFD